MLFRSAWGDENSGYAYFKVADGIEVYESSEFERIFSVGKEETWIKEDETND